MLLQILAILVMLAILSVLIIVHEFGHWSVARLFGFQTPVFGFGLPFGPHKALGRKWDTEFRVYPFCLVGGFVAIPELGDESNATEQNYGVPIKPFRKFPIWQRALVAFAGVAFNMIFAWILTFTMLSAFGEPSQPVVVVALPADNPIAANAGVKKGDKVLAVDDTQVDTPQTIVKYLSARPSTRVVLHLDRKGQKVDLPVTTNENGKVGMALEPYGSVRYKPVHGGPIKMITGTTSYLAQITGTMLDSIGQMVQGAFQPHHGKAGKASAPHLGFEDFHGALAVIAMGAAIAQLDWSQLFLFTILISMDLALINLLPWPALDGFHLAAMGLEAVRGKPMEERAQSEIVKWGFVSLLVLMALIMVNDVRSIIKGDFALSKFKHEDFDPDKDSKDSARSAPGGPAAPGTSPAPAPTTAGDKTAGNAAAPGNPSAGK
jgi:membrane-associated protease RseP (regulator of RpoE activity)